MLKQPPLATSRLMLKAISVTDQKAIYDLHRDEEVLRYINRQAPANEQVALDFIEKIVGGVELQRWYYWGLYKKDRPADLIGTICLWQFNEDRSCAEIGFDLLPSEQRQGLMQEAVSTVITFAQEQLRLKKVEAMVRAENQASIRLLERNGFRFRRELAEDEKFSGEAPYSILLYECLW